MREFTENLQVGPYACWRRDCLIAQQHSAFEIGHCAGLFSPLGHG